jgi:hypothetical protein
MEELCNPGEIEGYVGVCEIKVLRKTVCERKVSWTKVAPD